jgi:hypothetical protein
VPGASGFVFDEDCNVVSACPCDFSLDAYLALDVVPEDECYIDIVGEGTIVGSSFILEDNFFFQLDAIGCIAVDNNEAIEQSEYTAPDQTDACRSALLAIVGDLSIPPCP